MISPLASWSATKVIMRSSPSRLATTAAHSSLTTRTGQPASAAQPHRGRAHPTATLEQALSSSRQGRLRQWTPQDLVAAQPTTLPAGTAWSSSNTGYVLLGLVVETASHRTLGQELSRSILGPLGLGDTLLPDRTPELPGPGAHGYSLPPGPHGEALDGPLLGNAGGIPGFLSIALSTPDGHRQLGLMINALLAAAPLRDVPPRLPSTGQPAPELKAPSRLHAWRSPAGQCQGGGVGGCSGAARVARLRCSRSRSRAEPLVARISTASTPAARPHGGMLR
jgi:CubicO group peptidase (beta-lactamase class C family)